LKNSKVKMMYQEIRKNLDAPLVRPLYKPKVKSKEARQRQREKRKGQRQKGNTSCGCWDSRRRGFKQCLLAPDVKS
jgi:hypothetical protein